MVWPSGDGELRGQVYTSSGSAIGNEFQINVETADAEILPDVVALPSGGFGVTWRSPTDGVKFFEIGDIRARLFDGDGNALGQEFLVSTDNLDQSDPQITAFGSNDLAISYIGFDSFGASGLRMRLLYSTEQGSNDPDSIVGSDELDFFYGRGGNDFLDGGTDNDTLDGAARDDVLIGGGGVDAMDGGEGSDVYVIASAVDHSAAEISDTGIKRIVIGTGLLAHNVDARALLNGVEITGNSGAFTGTAGQLRYEQANGNTFVSGDTDGDGIADFMILLNGTHNLVSNDFLL